MSHSISKAHNAVAKAVKTGELASLPDGKTACVDCGRPAVVYDHRDYEKPLDVEPVCVSCNRKRGRAQNKQDAIITVRLSSELLAAVQVAATNDFRSVSNFIVRAVKEKLARIEEDPDEES